MSRISNVLVALALHKSPVFAAIQESVSKKHLNQGCSAITEEMTILVVLQSKEAMPLTLLKFQLKNQNTCQFCIDMSWVCMALKHLCSLQQI